MKSFFHFLLIALLVLFSRTVKADIIIQEDFSSGSIPTGWSTSAIQGTAVWGIQNAPAFGSTSGTFYAGFDDAALGAGVTPNESDLTTMSFDCSGRTAVYMNYQIIS